MNNDIDEIIDWLKICANDERKVYDDGNCADDYDQIAKWLEELKELRELKETYAKGMETSYSEFRYKQGIAEGYSKAENDYFAQSQKDREDTYNCGYAIGSADAINAIKNDLHGKLVEEQNKSYPDGSLCLGYYKSIKICDWYLNDNKECEE